LQERGNCHAFSQKKGWEKMSPPKEKGGIQGSRFRTKKGESEEKEARRGTEGAGAFT